MIYKYIYSNNADNFNSRSYDDVDIITIPCIETHINQL